MSISLGFDIGTTGIKTVLVNDEGVLLGSVTSEQHQYFPKPGWCEQDPEELSDLCIKNTADLCAKLGVDVKDITCLGLDHQGETCLVWEKATGKPVYPAITWQDRRMAAVSDEYGKVHGKDIEALTGLRSDSYYSAWKLRWILDNVKDGQKRAQAGELICGTLNTWFFWKWSAGKVFVTDEGSADVMMLCDPRHTGWNDWLLSEMNIPRCMLPEIVPCNSMMGKTDPSAFLGAEIPITASLADCSAGIVAAGAITPGDLVVTYGTGNFMHLITGDSYAVPRDGLTAACSFVTKDKRFYQLNGIGYTAGAAVKWLRNGLGLIQSASETETLARSVNDTNGVYFIPALNGLATPAWDQSARGAFLGITGGTTKAHMVRAVLESSALQVANCCRIMTNVSPIKPACIVAMGGMTANSFLMQLEADLCGIPVELPKETEPSYGSACMAFDGMGCGPKLADLKAINPPVKRYEPSMGEEERNNRIDSWYYAVKRTMDWYPEKH